MKTEACVWVLVAALVVVSGAPAPEPAPEAAPADDTRPEIIEIIAPAVNAQETLTTLNLGAPGSELSERNKRTIGILRQLFPTLTQIIEQKVQQITSFVLKTFGPLFLRAFLGGNNNGGGATGGGSGTVELDDDDDDDDDDDEPEPKTAAAVPAPATPSTTTMSDVPVTNAPAAVESEKLKTNEDNGENNEDKTETQSEDNNEEKTEIQSEDKSEEKTETQSEDKNEVKNEEDRRRRKRALFFLPNAIVEENQLLSGAESQQAEVRVAFNENQQTGDQQAAASEDQQTAAAGSSIDEISLDDADDSEENRNKRFLSFGGNSGGGGGGGSGNFLFDIVRQAPGAMARAAGSAFRLFAGTDSLNVGLTASHTASLDPNDPQLVAGSSSGASSGDSGAGEGDDGSAAKGDNLTEGVPGPITRLFIIANRGIANLIQDLILRIAQTSERIVNFKARLITSII